MRILAIAALTLAFGAGSALAECGWMTAKKGGDAVVAKSEQAATGAPGAASQPVKKAESEG